jgi:hypothetical protein
MLKAFIFSRNSLTMASVVLCCTAAGAGWGWYSAKAELRLPARQTPSKEQSQEIAFALPPSPPDLVENDEQAAIDPAVLRAWEVTARQPLPPRKEALTPPGWKIVGVTGAGIEQNVLLLFENQNTTEPKKVGDILPGGAKIVQISQDQLRIVLNGQLMKLNLRKQ